MGILIGGGLIVVVYIGCLIWSLTRKRDEYEDWSRG